MRALRRPLPPRPATITTRVILAAFLLHRPWQVEHELRLFLYPDPMPPLLFDIEKSTGVLGED